MQAHLAHWLELPRSTDVDTPNERDLVIDVIVTRYRTEEALLSADIPLFWRPMVETVSRIYVLKTGKDFRVTRVTQRMPWGAFFSRVFCWRGFFPKALASEDDMKWLLGNAIRRSLEGVKVGS